jgi:hypothetical protein
MEAIIYAACCSRIFIRPETVTGEIDSEHRVANGLKPPVTAEHDQRSTRPAVAELDPRYATTEELHGVSGRLEDVSLRVDDVSAQDEWGMPCQEQRMPQQEQISFSGRLDDISALQLASIDWLQGRNE